MRRSETGQERGGKTKTRLGRPGLYGNPMPHGNPLPYGMVFGVNGNLLPHRPHWALVAYQKRQVVHMAANIAALLDKAKDIHKLSSDYKLALVMGVSHRSLASYRHGMTLPDARVISKICALTGDDSAVLAAEMEAERATTEEARALWRGVVQRLQSTLHAAIFAVLTGVVFLGAFPSDAVAKTAISEELTRYRLWNVLRVIVHRWCMGLLAYIRGLSRIACHA